MFADDFIISITGKPGWINLDKYYTRLLGKESADVELMLAPLETDGVYSYDIDVLSMTKPDVKVSKTIYLKVLPQEDMPVMLDSFDMKKTDSVLDFSIGMNSSVSRELTLDFTVRDSSGSLLKSDSLTQMVEGHQVLEKRLELPGELISGNYNVLVEVKNMNLSQMASFYVPKIRKVGKTKKTVTNPLFQEVVITVTNQGNAEEVGYTVSENLPTSLIVSFIDPARCTVFEAERECEWTLGPIAPGDEASISYRIEYWPVLVIWGVIIVAIILIVIGTAKKAVKPAISKRIVRKAKGRHTVILEFSNPFYYTLSNVTVRDWLTPLARVRKEFKGPKPIVKATEAGTELIWRIGKVKPKDEIIIHYDIKTVVSGQLKVPKASAKYTTHKGGKDKVFSKGLVIE